MGFTSANVQPAVHNMIIRIIGLLIDITDFYTRRRA